MMLADTHRFCGLPRKKQLFPELALRCAALLSRYPACLSQGKATHNLTAASKGPFPVTLPARQQHNWFSAQHVPPGRASSHPLR